MTQKFSSGFVLFAVPYKTLRVLTVPHFRMTSCLAGNSKFMIVCRVGICHSVVSHLGIKEKERKGREGGSKVRKKEDVSNSSREIMTV